MLREGDDSPQKCRHGFLLADEVEGDYLSRNGLKVRRAAIRDLIGLFR